VPILAHNKAKETCTISVGVTSDGEVLLPLIIFKYKSTGKKKREAPLKYEGWTKLTHPCMTKFSDSGFNNLRIMGDWITELKKKLKDKKRKVILLLDTAPCHKGNDLNDLLKETNIELLYIPGGCTSFLQPLDITLNQKVKRHIKEFYSDWLVSLVQNIQQEDRGQDQQSLMTKAGNTKAPTLELIRDWAWKGYNELTPADAMNSFMFCGVTEVLSNESNLNKQLKLNLKSLITQFEEEAACGQYLDNFEQELLYTLNQESEIITEEEYREEDDLETLIDEDDLIWDWTI